MCDSCQTYETVDHVLFECPKFPHDRNLISDKKEKKLKVSKTSVILIANVDHQNRLYGDIKKYVDNVRVDVENIPINEISDLQ